MIIRQLAPSYRQKFFKIIFVSITVQERFYAFYIRKYVKARVKRNSVAIPSKALKSVNCGEV